MMMARMARGGCSTKQTLGAARPLFQVATCPHLTIWQPPSRMEGMYCRDKEEADGERCLAVENRQIGHMARRAPVAGHTLRRSVLPGRRAGQSRVVLLAQAGLHLRAEACLARPWALLGLVPPASNKAHAALPPRDHI